MNPESKISNLRKAPSRGIIGRLAQKGSELVAATALFSLAASGCLATPPTHPQNSHAAEAPACVYTNPLSGEKIEGKWSLCTDDLAFPDASLGDTGSFTDEIYDRTYSADLCAPLTQGKTFYRAFPGSKTALSVMCIAYDESDKQLHQGDGCKGTELSVFFPSRAFGTEITKFWAKEERFNREDVVSPFFVDNGAKTDGVFRVSFHPNSQRCGFHAVVYNGFGIRLK